MDPLRGRMDFEFETLRGEVIHEIEQKINAEVIPARPIRTSSCTRDEADRRPDLIRIKANLLPRDIGTLRVVEIEELDLQADGGTHVANTREVGRIRIKVRLSAEGFWAHNVLDPYQVPFAHQG